MPRCAAALAVLCIAMLAAASEKDDKAAAGFFGTGKVVRISIDLDKKELQSLRSQPRKYAKATLKADGKTVGTEVGVHVKGAAGSTRGIDDKPGLTLNMDKFKKGQRFFGMDKFHLANSVQDPTYLSELVCGELYRAAGVPASRIAHAVVTINGRVRGVYYVKEGYDKGFRKRAFGNADGNFYDGGFLRDIDQPLHKLHGGTDVKGHADLKALAKACDEPKEAERFKKIEKLLDMDRFITFACLSVLTCDWDGYPMNRNNYRVYHDPRRGKIVFIPSGMDQMFGDTNTPLLPNFQGRVARQLFQTKEGRSRYLKRMREIMDKVYKPDAIAKRLEACEKAIRPELSAIDKNAGRDYADRVKRLREAVKARAKNMADQLKRTTK